MPIVCDVIIIDLQIDHGDGIETLLALAEQRDNSRLLRVTVVVKTRHEKMTTWYTSENSASGKLIKSKRM